MSSVPRRLTIDHRPCDRVVASTVADCSVPTGPTTTSDVESVVVDRNESTVRVVASLDVQYDARLTVARISPTQQADTTTPQTNGTTTQTDGNVTVYAFVSTEETAVTSAVTRC